MKKTPKKDEAIEEIRVVRHRISAEFGHDTDAILKHYKEMESQFADRLVSSRKQTRQQTALRTR